MLLKATDIEALVKDGEDQFQRGDRAGAKRGLTLADCLFTQHVKEARGSGVRVGPLAGVTAATLLDFLAGGQHPVLDVVFGGIAGFFVGRKVSATYVDGLGPLKARIHKGLGDIARDEGDRTAARTHYAEAILACPDDPGIDRALFNALG